MITHLLRLGTCRKCFPIGEDGSGRTGKARSGLQPALSLQSNCIAKKVQKSPSKNPGIGPNRSKMDVEQHFGSYLGYRTTQPLHLSTIRRLRTPITLLFIECSFNAHITCHGMPKEVQKVAMRLIRA